MHEITLKVTCDEASGWLAPSWDAADNSGGITTQGEDLRDMQLQVTEVVAAYFDEGQQPRRVHLRW